MFSSLYNREIEDSASLASKLGSNMGQGPYRAVVLVASAYWHELLQNPKRASRLQLRCIRSSSRMSCCSTLCLGSLEWNGFSI